MYLLCCLRHLLGFIDALKLHIVELLSGNDNHSLSSFSCGSEVKISFPDESVSLDVSYLDVGSMLDQCWIEMHLS